MMFFVKASNTVQKIKLVNGHSYFDHSLQSTNFTLELPEEATIGDLKGKLLEEFNHAFPVDEDVIPGITTWEMKAIL